MTVATPKYLTTSQLEMLRAAVRAILLTLDGKSDTTPEEEALERLCRRIDGMFVRE